MNINGISNSVRSYDINGRKANQNAAATSFEEQISKDHAEGRTTSTAPAVVSADVSASATMSGADYLKLRQDCAVANSAEAKSAAEHKALRETVGSAGADNTATSETKQTAAPAAELPVVQATDTTEVKLEKLRQIAAASDYSGMSYEEIYTDLWNKYNDAFDGQLPAICSNATSMPPHWQKIFNQFSDEAETYVFDPLREEFKAQGINEGDPGYEEYAAQRYSDIRSAPLGYSGMTFEEKEAAILEKYEGKNSFLDFLSMQGELRYTMALRNKMGFDGERVYLSRMSSEVNNSYIDVRLLREGELTVPQRTQIRQGASSVSVLTEEQWNTILRGGFDTRSFLTRMQDSLQDVTFEDYDYDVRGMISGQIDGFLGLIDQHWQVSGKPVIMATDSVEVKLEKLRQLDEMSDYTGMSYDEIFEVIYTRYNDAFDGRLDAITGGASPATKTWIAINNQYVGEKQKRVDNPILRETYKLGFRRETVEESEWYVQQRRQITDTLDTLRGYEPGMTWQEKEQAILQKYQGKDTLLDFLSMYGELDDVYTKKMGFLPGGEYLGQVKNSIEGMVLSRYFTREEIIYSENGKWAHDLTDEQWELALTDKFDVRDCFARMTERLSRTTFSNYDYDVRGAIEGQMESFLAVWGEMNSELIDSIQTAEEAEAARENAARAGRSLSADEYRMEERRKEAGQTTPAV